MSKQRRLRREATQVIADLLDEAAGLIDECDCAYDDDGEREVPCAFHVAARNAYKFLREWQSRGVGGE